MSQAPPTFDAPLLLGPQIEARADHPELADETFLLQGDRTWTWRRYRDESVRTAHFLLQRLGPCDESRPAHVAMLLENHCELLSLLGGCGYAGLTLFGVNPGLRGETLAGVLDQSRARVLIVGERFWPEVERVLPKLKSLAPENVLVLRESESVPSGASDYVAQIESEVGPLDRALAPPDVAVEMERPLMVIYTSGTTGLPKGILNNHFKLLAIGRAISGNLELDRSATGYACMPLFHSNAMFIGFMPCFQVAGRLALRERFSASRFVPDVIEHGVTFWNYVGEPVHYVLGALEKQYGGDEERILAEVAGHPDNRMRYAIGNGASPPDIDRFIRWLGLEDMLELYGSTEAAISCFRRLGDPRGSVGEITDPAVKILDERGRECPVAELDADGKIANYADAVGEICRVASDTALFQGYFDNPDANESKYREGIYHSGDLGHVQVAGERRFLFFDGRTDDWIRKDGENFSAAQVARLVQEHPDVALAAAYGVPCSVSDELVMVALKLRPGATFDPQAFFDFCEAQVTHGSMDRKWFPDFCRIVDEFDYTQTQKILVRHLKKDHFHRGRLPDAPLYFRERGDSTFRSFSEADFDAVRLRFDAAERGDQLER
ncbi:MAG: AMP-binding protein [Myxococcales bacterium]|nr:AMP-binding protein [Myxococcales bacterium]